MTEELAYLVYELDEMMAYAETIEKEFSKSAKVSKTLIEQLNDLKKELVITSGDNYVGSAEPELRENISSLYSVVVGDPGKPSNTQLKNYEMLSEELAKAINDFTKIKEKPFKKLAKFAEKNEYKAFAIKSFEEFIK